MSVIALLISAYLFILHLLVYILAKELRPGKFRPTLTHSFVRLVHEKGLLLKCFTQNIDTLERRAGLPGDKLIEAHGSFASQSCIVCETPYDKAKMEEAIEQQKFVTCPKCKGLVKPDIVFFGESLPARFAQSLGDFQKADLLIIIGTSLTVYPFATLVELTRPDWPRVFINLERVNHFRQKRDDVVLLGRCDAIIEQLCKELGWYDDLLKLWAETEIKVPQLREVKPASEEVEELAEAINKQIKLDEDVTGEKPPQPDLTPSDSSKPSIKAEGEVTDAGIKPVPQAEASKSEEPDVVREGEKSDARREVQDKLNADDVQKIEEDESKLEGKL